LFWGVDRLRGDVAIYVKNDYHVVHRNDLEVIGVEYVWVEIKISKNHPVLIGTFHRPPKMSQFVNNLNHIVLYKYIGHVIVLGL
jgi:hypothetical protein